MSDTGTKDLIPEKLLEWAHPLLDYNSETYCPLDVIERIASLENELAAKGRRIDGLIKERDEYLNGLTATEAQLAQALLEIERLKSAKSK